MVDLERAMNAFPISSGKRAPRPQSAIDAHLKNPQSPPSPFVSGTISRAKAIYFATHGPNPSGQILRFVSSRVPRLGSIRDQEGLFTGYVGAPYEQGNLETAK